MFVLIVAKRIIKTHAHITYDSTTCKHVDRNGLCIITSLLCLLRQFSESLVGSLEVSLMILYMSLRHEDRTC